MAGSAAPAGGAGGGTIDPSVRSGASETMLARTGMLRAVYGGTETMRAQGETFLPKYERETQTRYDARLAAAVALNKMREAVDAASAKPFKTLIKIKEPDANLDLWQQNIDLEGNHLHLFSHRLFNNSLLDGQCHFLVDHPTTTNLPNLAAQKAAEIRPYFKLIPTTSLIAAYSEYVGGKRMVTHARFQSQRIERLPDYSELVWDQIYVIEVQPGTTNGVSMIYEREAGKDGDWTMVSQAPLAGLLEVPLVTLQTGDVESPFVSRSIFTDLAYKQIEHFQSSSDQRSILSAARFPMLAASGIQLEDEFDEADPEGANVRKFEIGPYKLLVSPDPNGRWYYVEPKGTAIQQGREDIEMLELQMDVMALNPVTATHRQYVPQNERDIQETRVHSVIHDAALACKDAIERGLGYFSLWGGPDYSQTSVTLNADFSNTGDKLKEAGLLVQMADKGFLSPQSLLVEIQQRDLLNDTFDINAEVPLVEQIRASIMAKSATQGDANKEPGSFDGTGGTSGTTRPTKEI